MRRIPPSLTMKEAISTLLQTGTPDGHPLDALVRASARYMLQVALEQEVTDFLGRAHYQRGARRQAGHRNGYEPRALKTAEGAVTLALPQVRRTVTPFTSRLLERLGTQSGILTELAIRMYVRGLSVRDVDGAFAEATGERLLSKSAVSRLTKTLDAEFDAWRGRDLTALPVVYLFLDAIFLPLRQGSHEKEGVLCAYGVLESGQKVLLHLALGNRESYDAWLSFLHDLTGRGLGEPVLVCSDGNPGLRRALREVFPHALKQRCLVHKLRNILGKLPKAAMAAMKRLLRPVFEARDYATGLRKGRELIARFRERFPSAMGCLEEDLEACLVHLKLPWEHRKRIRTTNLLERLFGEGKRRTRVIPRFPTERSGLKLLYATLLTASKTWRGVKMTPALLREIDAVRGELGQPKVKQLVA